MEAETNRDKVLRGEVVRVSDKRLLEMQEIAIKLEGVSPHEYHWHFAAVINELIFARRIAAAAASLRGIDLTPPSGGDKP